ncbi:cytochrome P450 [Melittangium boletus]|uniref:Cytochrome P450 hydroxylase n=1 Tax=Melittangium boletus DSM 14713 TaxID=1294270 RepID=A0A250ITA9_9BACT|nr:cytochrome P450 [Melittangium boletus]ATB34470.1 hypothetical protein MEBOL_007973 [Melittangium boletus DSM 14713]
MSLLDGFDFLDPRFRQNPYPYFAEMRERAPLLWNERMKSWLLSRHEDVAFALKNAALFSSSRVQVGGRPRGVFQVESVAELITADPPVHTQMRGLVSRAFTPRQINALEPRVRELSRELIAEMTSRSEFDFMDALASPLPVTIIAEMLGIDPVRRRDFKRWSDTIIAGLIARLPTGEEPEAATRSRAEMRVYMTEVAEARRREPRGDLISLLVQETDGVPALSPQEVNAFTMLLLIAGNETTTNLLGNTLLALIRHPEQYEALRRDPSLAACSAVCEETLRFDSPVLGLSRRTTQEVEVGGGKIPAESMVVLLLGSANHDPRKFPEPERFDPTRDTHGLMSFGHGIHFCLGAPLTRVEAPVALRELMEHVPRLGFSPRQSEHLDYGPTFALRGPRSLWLQKN